MVDAIDDHTFKNLETNEQKEEYVFEIARTLIKNNEFEKLSNLIITLSKHWTGISTARLTKIIKRIFFEIKITYEIFENLHMFLKSLIDWAGDKKLLKLDLECKLIGVYLSAGKYRECLESISNVSKDLKKYDDKVNLISLYVYESRAYYELQDFGRAKSSLTSARALAVSSACPSELQAQIDLLNGMYLSDEHTFDTAISYFMESLEGFLQDKSMGNARVALRYIILNKILCFKFDDINTILSAKYVSEIKDDQFVGILCSISKICKKRDVHAYNEILANNAPVLEGDAYTTRHLLYLYNILLDQNILKIIEPYSHVKISFVASKLNLSENVIEDKLRKMILDDVISGILDHDTQCLILYDAMDNEENESFKEIKIFEEFLGKI